MKNLTILSLMALLLSITSCKKAAQKAENATETAVHKTEQAAKAVADKAIEAKDAVVSAVTVPSFKDPAIGQYLTDYSNFIGKYEAMMKSGEELSAEKLKEMRDKANQFALNSKEVVSKLKADELDKFNNFFQKIQQRWSNANRG